MHTINTIWFDLGMTLVRQNREEITVELLRELGIDISTNSLEMAYHLTDKKYMRNRREYEKRGRLEFLRFYFESFVEISGIDADPFKLLKIMESGTLPKRREWTCFDYTHGVLETLRKDFSLGLISNWDGTAREVLHKNDLEKYFDFIVISDEAGCEKPDREIFDLALDISGRKASECIYVGDNYYDDVVGSAKVGMKSLLINRFGNYGIEEIDHEVIYGIHELPEILSEIFLTGRKRHEYHRLHRP